MANDATMKGNAAFAAGRWREAISFFTDAINLDPTNHLLYSNRSAALASIQIYHKAVSDAVKAIVLKPDWPQGYIHLAALYLGIGSIKEAITTYKKGLEIDPSNVALKAGLASALRRLPGFQNPFLGSDLRVERPAAVMTRDFLKNLEEVKENPSVPLGERMMRALGAIPRVKAPEPMELRNKKRKADELKENEEAMGEYGEFMKESNKAAKRGRNIREAWNREATELAKRIRLPINSYDPAIETFQKASTKHSDPDPLKGLNDEKENKFFMEQMYTKAIKYHSEALCNVYGHRAAWYMRLGSLPEGLKDAEECIRLDPSSPKGYCMKGSIQFLMKDYDKALETYHEGLKRDPNNQDLVHGVLRCVEHIKRSWF